MVTSLRQFIGVNLFKDSVHVLATATSAITPSKFIVQVTVVSNHQSPEISESAAWCLCERVWP